MNTIYHITQLSEWENGQRMGIYKADSLETEGFIHCSTFTQAVKTANRFFKNQPGLVLLYINVDKVKPEIRYESADNDLFPHIYGGLNVDAVYKVIDFEPGEDGLFELIKE